MAEVVTIALSVVEEYEKKTQFVFGRRYCWCRLGMPAEEGGAEQQRWEEQRESWWCRSAGGWGQGITRFRAKLQFLLRPFDPA